MINGLTDYKKFKVIRPLAENHIYDEYGMPVIQATSESMIDIVKAKPVNIKNLTCKNSRDNQLVLPFNYDKELNRYWANPLKYVPMFQNVMAVGSPDYSVYPSMNINEIRHNVYKGKWYGCMLQEHGCVVLPTIPWATPETYDICFSGVERGGVVMISTLGVTNHPDIFLQGFNEMQSRLSPQLIIVYGNMINGMYRKICKLQL